MKASTLPQTLLDRDNEASGLCLRYQIRPTHDAWMVWRLYDEWKMVHLPFKDRDLAVEYLIAKLPEIPDTWADIIRFP